MAKERKSNIELLKVLAIIMVVIAHNAPEANNVKLRGQLAFLFDTSAATTDWRVFIIIVNFYLAQLAVCIFLVCSAYFLTDSRKVDPKKILHIWTDIFFVSAVYVIILKILYPEMAWTTFFKEFLPISTGANWYVVCYLLLYAVHPLLNIIIRNLSQRDFLIVTLCGAVVYCGVEFVLPGEQYYYTKFIGFVVVYFLVAYMKSHLRSVMENKKFNVILCVTSLLLLVGLIAITNLLGLKVNALSHSLKHWRIFSNPLIVLCALSLFNLFKRLKFQSRVINYISSNTLLIYIIHENRLFREYVRTDYFGWVYYTHTYDRLLLWCLLLAVVSFIGSFVIAVLYRATIRKALYKAGDKLYDSFYKRWNGFLDNILKLQ